MPSLTTEQSQLYPDISDIVEAHDVKYSGAFSFETKLHTVDKDLDYTDGVILNGITIIRDYVENVSDYIEIQLSVPLGTYIYDIYKYLDNIELTLITQKQKYQDKKPFITKERYKAVYLMDKNSKIPTQVNQSKDDLNQNLPIVITLQLLDRSVETLRIKTTQGNFDSKINPKNKDMSPKAFLKSIISEEANKILIENKPPLDAISIEEPDQQDDLKAITIPSYTRIVELPEFLQEKNIGVYNAGIGNYIQTFGTDHYTFKKTMFIYSLYDPQKYDKAEYKIIFYSPASSAISLSEITYKNEDKVLRAIPYTMTKIHDDKGTNTASTGSGFRMANANSYMKKPVEMKEDGPSFKRNSLNTEVTYKDRPDGLNFAPNKSVSNNQFSLTSQILRTAGAYITLDVGNLDHDFIYPGACKVMYEDNENKIKEVLGVIHKAFINYSSSSMNMPLNYNSRVIALTSHTTLQIFCQLE